MHINELDWTECNKSCCVAYTKKRFPIISWLPHYNLGYAKRDIIAGITVGLMTVPQALADGAIANLPPVYGLYTAFIGVWTYIFLGSSKDVVVGPTAIMSAMVGSTARGNVKYAVCLSAVAGVYVFALGLLQFGWLVRLISYPTLAGFVSGAVTRIIIGQVEAFLGIVGSHSGGGLIEVISDLASWIDAVRWGDAEIGFIVLVVLVTLKLVHVISTKKYEEEVKAHGETGISYLWTSLSYLALMKNIIVVVIATVVAFVLYKDDMDPLIVVGPITPGIQSPDLTVFSTFPEYWPQVLLDGLIIALVAMLEQLSIAKAFSKKNCYKVENSQEMIATGMCNIIGSFFQCYPVTGSFSRSSVNSDSGVKTQAGGLWSGLIAVLALVLLTPLFRFVPRAALASVIMVAVSTMADFKVPVNMWSVRKLGTVTWVLTFASVLFLGVEIGILVGFGCEILQLLTRNLRPDIKTTDMGEGVVMMKMRGGCNFLGAEHFTNKVEEILQGEGKDALLMSYPISSIIIDMSSITELDMTALQTLKDMAEGCKEQGVTVFSVGLSREFDEDFTDSVVQIRNFDTADEAVNASKIEMQMNNDNRNDEPLHENN